MTTLQDQAPICHPANSATWIFTNIANHLEAQQSTQATCHQETIHHIKQ